MTTYLVTAALGTISGIIPGTPVEPYLVGTVATGHASLWLALVAASGQSIGKVGQFLVARGTIRSPRMRRWLDRCANRAADMSQRNRLTRGMAALMSRLDQPALTAPIVFLSAFCSLPPLLVTSVYAARTQISARTFGSVCLAGRSIRFALILLVPQLLLGA